MNTKIIGLSMFIVEAISLRIEPRQKCNPMPAHDMCSMGMAVVANPSDIPTGCSEFEVLITRGMGEQNSESNGKFEMVLGDQLMSSMTALIPGARGYPVQYPASTNVAGDKFTGSVDIINRLIKQSTACSDQRFALVGYSQGAIVIHAAAVDLPSEIVPKVLAVVLYGDPTITSPEGVEKMPDALYKRLQENCSKGDHTCDTSKECHYDHAKHMDYTKQPWIDRGAKFIAAAFKGTPIQAETGGTLTL